MKLTFKRQYHNQTYRFSMVELVLCLVVVIVGIIGIMGTFPVGLDSNKKAMVTSFSADAGEQFLRFNASKIKSNWNWINVFANSKPSAEDPAADFWDNRPVFELGNIRISAEQGLDENEEDSNTGFFLLEQLTDGETQFAAVLRVWKDPIEVTESSKSTMLHVEVSWPYGIPYNSPEREFEQFDMEAFTSVTMSLDNGTYDNCTVTKAHGEGYTTTLNRVTDTGNNSYEIELIVASDGCGPPECKELASYLVEGTPTAGTAVIPTGNPVTNASDQSITSPFAGFEIGPISAMGGGRADSFTLTYTLPALQDQQVVAKTTSAELAADFSIADFDYVLNCASSQDDPNDPEESCEPSEFNTVFSLKEGKSELMFGCDAVQVRSTVANKKIRYVRFKSFSGASATVNVQRQNIYDTFVTVDIPEHVRPVYAAQVKSQAHDYSKYQMTDALCNTAGDNAPVCQNSEFTLGYQPRLNRYWCRSISQDDFPTDADGGPIFVEVGDDGPSWLYWDPGIKQLAGTPDIGGSFTWTLTFSDGCQSCTSEVTINMQCDGNAGLPPVWSTTALPVTRDYAVGETLSFAIDSGLVTDPDGNSLTISLVDGPNWMTLVDEQLSGVAPEAGTFTWTLRADDGCNEADATLTVNVIGATYAIVASADHGGWIDPMGTTLVNENGSQTYTIIPDTCTGSSSSSSGRSTGGSNGRKVQICHIPPGNPSNAHTIEVSENAVSAHLAHGDVLGACPDDSNESSCVNYIIEDVLVDGTSVGPVSSYTFPDVSSDHTIHAIFSLESDEDETEPCEPLAATFTPDGAFVTITGGDAGLSQVKMILENNFERIFDVEGCEVTLETWCSCHLPPRNRDRQLIKGVYVKLEGSSAETYFASPYFGGRANEAMRTDENRGRIRVPRQARKRQNRNNNRGANVRNNNNNNRGANVRNNNNNNRNNNQGQTVVRRRR